MNSQKWTLPATGSQNPLLEFQRTLRNKKRSCFIQQHELHGPGFAHLIHSDRMRGPLHHTHSCRGADSSPVTLHEKPKWPQDTKNQPTCLLFTFRNKIWGGRVFCLLSTFEKRTKYTLIVKVLLNATLKHTRGMSTLWQQSVFLLSLTLQRMDALQNRFSIGGLQTLAHASCRAP